jgi:serine/threonine protein kinase
VEILNLIDHPNCIKLLDSFYSADEHENKYLNMIFEYAPSMTLKEFIRNGPLPLSTVKNLFYQLCRALEYLHDLNIVHRDLKPENILVQSEDHILKVIDFGSAKRLRNGDPNIAYVVSRFYRAPEVLCGNPYYTTKLDVWSAGCILFELTFGKPLFPGRDTADQLAKIVGVLGSPTQDDLLALNPLVAQRHHEWPPIKPISFVEFFPAELKEMADLLTKMLQYNPLKRISIAGRNKQIFRSSDQITR